MNRPLMVAGLILTLGTTAAHAEIYRCERAGKITYTDKSCAAGTQPQDLPDLTVIKPIPGQKNLARDYDKSLERERKARDKADAQWLKGYRASKAKEERVRAGLINGKVVSGMTPQQVRQVLGEPAGVQRDEEGGVAKERWTYRNGSGQQTVQFRNGEVTRSSLRESRQKK